MRRLQLLALALLFGGCAASGRTGRHEPPPPNQGRQGMRGDLQWEDQVFRAYERRLDAPGNPVRKASGSPERMSPRAFKKWASRHDQRVTGWERRQAQAVADRFRITADEVLRIYCSVLARRFSEGAR